MTLNNILCIGFMLLVLLRISGLGLMYNELLFGFPKKNQLYCLICEVGYY